MADLYIPQEIEPKWQKKWEDDRLYRALIAHDKPKHYALTMLPYPSGDLHIGHWYAMSPSDVRARYMRMKGYNVLFPIGFDAFGLPAENAAIKRGVHPQKWTLSNIDNMRQQLRSMGAMFDWEREAVSCLPGYYVWSQWFFLKLYDMGLAYRKKSPVDFCPKCNTTLAREQVWGEDRHCERCETPVVKKELAQWFWRITNYADELLDFSQIDWPERVVTMQTNWVGRSEGADVTFISEQEDEIVVFTTRPDTLWGATFMVLAPEHPLVDKLTTSEHRKEVTETLNARSGIQVFADAHRQPVQCDEQENCQNHGRSDPKPTAQQDGLTGKRHLEHRAEGGNVHVHQAKNGQRHLQSNCPRHIVDQGGENQRHGKGHILFQYQLQGACSREY